ncbi:aldo/keto reductase [Georgenia sp. 10Sc9-8]|uniref:Aldo/keto reductase n=1 Tax=Georgenia halotolerans TaxID=3028317 RepID=A0ABT5TXL9_9MICO|nr:aldo/keto reductase [Georgenia halotolerans]
MTPAPQIPQLELNDGHHLPVLGLGTYAVQGEDGVAALSQAIQDGYRLLDTAASYGNEREVGAAVAASGVPRDELLLTSKVRGQDQGYDAARRAAERTLRDLGVDRLDLYLIHWPLPRLDLYVETWRALVDLRDEGLVRSVGVSNFTAEHLDRLVAETGVVPAVNQIELHPYFTQAELRAVHAARAVVTESWSPLGRKSTVLTDPAVVEAAENHGVSPAQAVLRWHVQLGVVAIPKSANRDRWRANLDIFGFELSAEEMERLSSLEQVRLGGDPLTHEEF